MMLIVNGLKAETSSSEIVSGIQGELMRMELEATDLPAFTLSPLSRTRSGK